MTLPNRQWERKKQTQEVFEKYFQKAFLKGGINSQIIESFYKIYAGLKTVKEKGRDSIWKFICTKFI